MLALAALVNFAPILSLNLPGMQGYRFHGPRIKAMPGDQVGGLAAALGITGTAGIGIIVYPSHKDPRRKIIGLAYTLSQYLAGRYGWEADAPLVPAGAPWIRI